MSKRFWIGIAASIAVAFFTWFYFTPHLTVLGLAKAIETHDAAALERYIDFPAVKESLKASLNAKFASDMSRAQESNPLAGLGLAFGPILVNAMVDAYITPEGLASMMKGENPPGVAGVPTPNPHIAGSWAETKMAYESFDRFLVTVPSNLSPDNRVDLVLRRNGPFSWKLAALRLPLSIPKTDVTSSPTINTTPLPLATSTTTPLEGSRLSPIPPMRTPESSVPPPPPSLQITDYSIIISPTENIFVAGRLKNTGIVPIESDTYLVIVVTFMDKEGKVLSITETTVFNTYPQGLLLPGVEGAFQAILRDMPPGLSQWDNVEVRAKNVKSAAAKLIEENYLDLKLEQTLAIAESRGIKVTGWVRNVGELNAENIVIAGVASGLDGKVQGVANQRVAYDRLAPGERSPFQLNVYEAKTDSKLELFVSGKKVSTLAPQTTGQQPPPSAGTSLPGPLSDTQSSGLPKPGVLPAIVFTPLKPLTLSYVNLESTMLQPEDIPEGYKIGEEGFSNSSDDELAVKWGFVAVWGQTFKSDSYTFKAEVELYESSEGAKQGIAERHLNVEKEMRRIELNLKASSATTTEPRIAFIGDESRAFLSEFKSLSSGINLHTFVYSIYFRRMNIIGVVRVISVSIIPTRDMTLNFDYSSAKPVAYETGERLDARIRSEISSPTGPRSFHPFICRLGFHHSVYIQLP